jgi:hypothetical protein
MSRAVKGELRYPVVPGKPRKGAPEHPVLAPLAEAKLEVVAFLERMAARAERQWKRDPKKVGHQLGAIWLRASAQSVRHAASLDRRYIRPFDPPAPEPTAATKASARRAGAKRR